MLTLRSLENKVYDGRKCISFEYNIKVKDAQLYVKFMRDCDTSWRLIALMPKTLYADSKVYTLQYSTMKSNVKLEFVAALGLKHLQNEIKKDIENLMALDFEIGQETEGVTS